MDRVIVVLQWRGRNIKPWSLLMTYEAAHIRAPGFVGGPTGDRGVVRAFDETGIGGSVWADPRYMNVLHSWLNRSCELKRGQGKRRHG
jgi:hypothetical protein